MQKTLFGSEELEINRLPKKLVSDTFKGIYASHKYWSKKPGNIIRQFISAFTNPNEIVFDPFFGYGVTIIESLASGRLAIGVDINPASIRIIKGLILYCNLEKLKLIFNKWIESLNKIQTKWFMTKCEKGHNAHRTHALIKDNQIQLIRFNCINCNCKGEKSPDNFDIENWKKSLEIDIIEEKYPNFLQNKRISAYESMRVSALFTKRNFHIIEEAFKRIKNIESPYREQLYNIFTAAIPQASKMVFVISGRNNRDKPEVGSWVTGFWQPEKFWEISPILCFQNRFKKYLRGKLESNERLSEITSIATEWNDLSIIKPLIIRSSSTELDFIPNNSVDYILTDPPHGDRVPYLEYSQLWNSFFQNQIDWNNEIVVSDRITSTSGREKYKELLFLSLNEISEKLKWNRFFTIFFQNLDFDYWNTLFSSLRYKNLNLMRIDSIQTSAGSVVQDTRKNSLLTDIALTFKKEKHDNNSIKVDENKSVSKEVALDTIKASTKDKFHTHDALEWIITAFINNNCLNPSFNLIKLLEDNFHFKNGSWYK